MSGVIGISGGGVPLSVMMPMMSAACARGAKRKHRNDNE